MAYQGQTFSEKEIPRILICPKIKSYTVKESKVLAKFKLASIAE